MEINLFFNKEPKLEWQKINCPVCGNPTGPASKCYEEIPPGMPKHKRKLFTKQMGIVPIYSVGCAFRQDNFWSAKINYPVSQILLKRISKIKGIDKLLPTQPYSFQISIAPLFSEGEIKKEITIAYKSFIKEMQAKEMGILEHDNNMKLYSGITFPNGNSVMFNGSCLVDKIKNSQLAHYILDNMPGTSGSLEIRKE